MWEFVEAAKPKAVRQIGVKFQKKQTEGRSDHASVDTALGRRPAVWSDGGVGKKDRLAKHRKRCDAKPEAEGEAIPPCSFGCRILCVW